MQIPEAPEILTFQDFTFNIVPKSDQEISIYASDPKKIAIYEALEVKLKAINIKTITAALNKKNDVQATILFTPKTEIQLEISFDNPYIGKFSETITMKFSRDIKPSDHLEMITMKLKEVKACQERCKKIISRRQTLFEQIDEFGTKQYRALEGYDDYCGDESYYDETGIAVNYPVCKIRLPKGKFLIIVSCFLLACYGQYRVSFSRFFSQYGYDNVALNGNDHDTYPRHPIIMRGVITLNEPQQLEFRIDTFQSNPVILNNCIITAEPVV